MGFVDASNSLFIKGFSASAWRKNGSSSTVESTPVPAFGERDLPKSTQKSSLGDNSRFVLQDCGSDLKRAYVKTAFKIGHWQVSGVMIFHRAFWVDDTTFWGNSKSPHLD
jgi:hypothetical protein